jgi:hypothetical protein
LIAKTNLGLGKSNTAEIDGELNLYIMNEVKCKLVPVFNYLSITS